MIKFKNKKIGCVAIIVFFVIFFVLLRIIFFIIDDIDLNKSKNNLAKIEDLIEQEDFVEAKKLSKKIKGYDRYEVTDKVVRAQISSLIDDGQFDIAADVANEESRYYMYYDLLLMKLIPLYDTNKQGMFIALAQLKTPSLGSPLKNWNGENGNIGESKVNTLHTSFNNSLSQLMKYAINKGDKDTAIQLAALLKPLYKQVKGKVKQWSNKEQKDILVDGMVWENIPTDYTQANQIKKELGIK